MSFQLSSRGFPSRITTGRFQHFLNVATALAIVAGIFVGIGGSAIAQQPNVHALIDSSSAPGVTGRKLLKAGRIKPATYQPVKIVAPDSAIVSTAFGSGFSQEAHRATLGLLVGRAYRFKVSYVTNVKEYVVYPTVELIDSLDPPEGKEQDFPVPVEFTAEEIEMAAAGNMVTRVVYVEDPKLSLPSLYQRGEAQPWFETEPGTDPLAVADTLGRPIAIVRIGSRALDSNGPTAAFLFQSPPVNRYGGVPLAIRTKTSRVPGLSKKEVLPANSVIKSYEFEIGDQAPGGSQASHDKSEPKDSPAPVENTAMIEKLAPAEELAPVDKLAPVEEPVGKLAPVASFRPVKVNKPPIKKTPIRSNSWNRLKAKRASWKK